MNHQTPRRLAAVVLVGSLLLAACGDDDDTAAASGDEVTTTTEATTTTTAESATTATIAEVATEQGSTFIPSYTQHAPNFKAALEGDAPVTALMPTDDAFFAFSSTYPETTNTLRSDLAALDVVLTYHVLDGAQLAEALAGETEVMTLQGEPITVKVEGDTLVLNDGQAKIAIADLEAKNGVVHILDGILLPPSMAADAR